MSHRFTTAQRAEVLLADHNENDVLLTRVGFHASKLLVNLHTVETSAQCLAFLRKQAPFAHAPSVDLILIDLNLPGMGGREVLSVLHHDEALKQVPVVVLTTSPAQVALLGAYQLRCNAFLVKPIQYNRFVEVITKLGDDWLDIITQPPSPESKDPPSSITPKAIQP